MLLCGTISLKVFGGNIDKSTLFEVQIDGADTFVGVLNQFDIPIHTVQISLDIKKSINICIKAKEDIKNYSISPLSKNIKGTIIDKNLTFSIDKAEYLIIKINDLEYLFLMIDTPIKTLSSTALPIKNILDYGIDNTGNILSTDLIQKAIIDAAKNKNILYFPEGIYKTGQLNLVDNSAIHLAPKAYIKASTDTIDFPDKTLININKAHNIKIEGHGTIDGSGYTGLHKNGGQGYHLIYMSECKDIEIDGLLLLDPCFWNARVYRSENVHLKNIKILNNRPEENWINTDGVDFDSSINCSLVNAILHCGDDNLVVKGLDHERKFNTENILFEKVITLSNSAATKIGTETCVEYFKNIIFKDIDIVKCKRALVINAYDSAMIKNIVFENINIESFHHTGFESPRIIDFEITDNSWRPCTGNCIIDNVKINNINIYCNIQDVDSQILGKSEKYSAKNISIKNIFLNKKRITNLDAMNMKTNEYVFNLELKQ